MTKAGRRSRNAPQEVVSFRLVLFLKCIPPIQLVTFVGLCGSKLPIQIGPPTAPSTAQNQQS